MWMVWRWTRSPTTHQSTNHYQPTPTTMAPVHAAQCASWDPNAATRGMLTASSREACAAPLKLQSDPPEAGREEFRAKRPRNMGMVAWGHRGDGWIDDRMGDRPRMGGGTGQVLFSQILSTVSGLWAQRETSWTSTSKIAGTNSRRWVGYSLTWRGWKSPSSKETSSISHSSTGECSCNHCSYWIRTGL